MGKANMYIAVAYTLLSLIMVTITRRIFIYIFQRERFSAVKFAMGLWEKYELSCDTKIARSFEKSY